MRFVSCHSNVLSRSANMTATRRKAIFYALTMTKWFCRAKLPISFYTVLCLVCSLHGTSLLPISFLFPLKLSTQFRSYRYLHIFETVLVKLANNISIHNCYSCSIEYLYSVIYLFLAKLKHMNKLEIIWYYFNNL